jgi:hypothetical protein
MFTLESGDWIINSKLQKFSHSSSGKGQFRTSDGDRYEGDWKVGNQDGTGEYRWANGDCP